MPKYRNLKPYVINKAEDNKSAEVNLYGEIVNDTPTDWYGEPIDGLYIILDKFLKDIEPLKDMTEIRFNINSVGGAVDAGVAIFNKIREMKGKTITRVEGAAASAASLVAQAGDVRQVCVGSETMVHCASCYLFDSYNSKALDEIKNMLDSADKRIAQLLADRTGKSEAEIKRMMQKTTWMTAEEAVENGFADEIVNETVKVENVKNKDNVLIFNGIPHYFRGSMPKIGQVANTIHDLNGYEPFRYNKIQNNKEDKIMTLDELKTQYPDLVNQIKNEAKKTAQTNTDEAVKNATEEAVKAEQERIKAIDSIASKISPELVNEAKYGETKMTAEQLALKALQTQEDIGRALINDRASELQNTKLLVASPVNGSEEDTEAKDIADGAALLNAAMKF
jgi:ATP-dependent protease ClpP protease subunit